MSRPLDPSRKISAQRRWFSSEGFLLGLPTAIVPTTLVPTTLVLASGIVASGLLFAVGCGGPSADQPKVQVVQQDPQGEFEWGIERLKRALWNSRPSRSNGLNITERTVKHELFPPNDANPAYTARVMVTTETSFLHGRRSNARDEKPKGATNKALEIDDPLDDISDESNNVIDIPGTGPQAPLAASTRIETRSLENQTVFEMAYIDGQWKLTQQPELKHEQLWFEYAFE